MRKPKKLFEEEDVRIKGNPPANKHIIKLHTSIVHKTMAIKLISKFYYVISVFKVDVSS